MKSPNKLNATINTIFEDPREFLNEIDGKTIKREKTKCPHIQFKIENIKIQGLIDTGSLVTCLSEDFYNRNKNQFKNCPKFPLVGIQAIGFNGSKSNKLKLQLLANVECQGHKKELIFLVVPNLVRDCILGMDSLEKLKMIIDTSDKTIIFKDSPNEVFQLEDYYKEDQAVVSSINEIFSSFYSDEEPLIAEITTNPISMELKNEEIDAKLEKTVGLDQNDRNKLKALLVNYRDIFSKRTGKLKDFQYKFNIKTADPYFYKTYPTPVQYRNKVDIEIEKLLAHGIIETSDSEFINPLIVILKRNLEVRLCLDARELNSILKMDYEGAESIDEILTKCTNIKFMSSFDLNMSFWQIELHPESRKYTAFLYEGKVYQFRVVLFGTKVSGAALCRGSRIAFKKLENFLLSFIDDHLCISQNFENHLEHLKMLFDACRNYNLTLNFEKANLCSQEIKF